MAITKIQTITVSSAQASIDFTSIPATYTDLLLLLSARSTSNDGNPWTGVTATFNGGATTGIRLYSASVGTWTSDTPAPLSGFTSGSNATADVFGNNRLFIPDYLGSNNKVAFIDSVAESDATPMILGMTAILRASTAAINQITLTLGAGNFDVNSAATLYGIKNS